MADDDVGGVEILVTGGHAVDGFFVRSAPQVDQLLRWLCEQHAAGVTVRGGKLRPPGRVREEGVRKGKGGCSRPVRPSSPCTRPAVVGTTTCSAPSPCSEASVTPCAHSPEVCTSHTEAPRTRWARSARAACANG